ncbi:MAG: NADH-quinone oxidoreductase subunit NuoH [Actinomycetota bacterium]
MDWLDLLLVVIKVAFVFFGLLITVMLVIWMERKVVADMQNRPGPLRAGPRGILISLADGMKLFFKEGITPADADRPVFLIAPTIALIPAFLAFAVIPFGAPVELFGRTVNLQLADLSVGILWVLAMSSVSVYGVVLAGWSSGSRYPLIGSIRSSAQMISYEVGMGLALVAVLMWTGTLSMSGIVEYQRENVWNVIPQFPAFVIYIIAALAEINRPPFDLPEAETELVAGYHTEYSGIKFAMFFLGEYVNLVTVSAIAVTLFLGGWSRPPFIPAVDFLPWLWPIVWFALKLLVVIYFYIWVRATLPRLRYDRLMNFGWKLLIPIGLLWILATGAVIVVSDQLNRNLVLTWVGVVAGIGFILTLLWPSKKPVEGLAEDAKSGESVR